MCDVFDEVDFGCIVNHITIACKDSSGPASRCGWTGCRD